MADAAESLSVVIDDNTDSVRVDPVNGTIEVDQPDGGTVVHLDAGFGKKDDEDSEFYDNLADDIGDMRLGQIANELIDAISADDSSRQEHLAIRARGLGLLGIKLEEPRSSVGDSSSGVDGMSSVTNPLLLEAVLKGWANAVGELLPADGPCKIRDDGEETAQDDELADSLERDFNHYLTKGAPEYYPDTSHMLLWGTYFGGSGFKKVYRCPLRRRPVSDSVDEKDLIVSDTTKDLRACARITHEIPMRPSVMKRMKFIGAYRSVPLTQPNPTPSTVDAKIAGIQGTAPAPDRPEDQPYTIWETQCELDLPEFAPGKFKSEGIPLPYLVTIDKDSREILSIRRDWKEDDEECERRQMYVKYPYVPGPGFYGTGLLNILGNASAAMTAAWREALDAGMFASFPAFLVAKGMSRQNTSDFRLSPGTGQPIDTNGMPIGQAVMGIPYKDVTAGLLGMMDRVLTQSKDVGGAADIPVGEGVQNVPVGTMLAAIEQATKIMSAAHKGMHQAQGEEFSLLLEVIRENPEDFIRAMKGNKACQSGFWDEAKLLEAIKRCNLVPVSDPNVPSHVHRIAKAMALFQLALSPFGQLMEGEEVLRRLLRVIKEDPNGLIKQAQPQGEQPPDLVGIAKIMDAQTRAADAQTKARKVGLEAVKVQQDAQFRGAELQVDRDKATIGLAKDIIIHSDEKDRNKAAQSFQQGEADRKHGLAVAGHGLSAFQAMSAAAQPKAPKKGKQ